MLNADNVFPCELCIKTFPSLPSLKQHVRRNHHGNEFRCNDCEYLTKFKGSLIRHITRHHLGKINPKIDYRIRSKCPLCVFECVSRQEMVLHYTSKHGITIQEQHFDFEDYGKFSEWKERLEQTEMCQFTIRTGMRNRRSVRIRYYRCFRDGVFQKKGKGLRQMKLEGSIKMNGVCPASIKAEEIKTTGVVSVTYISTHVGHLQEPRRMDLSRSERAAIVRKRAKGIPYEDVLNSASRKATNRIEKSNLTACEDLWDAQSNYDVLQAEKDSENQLNEGKMKIRSKVEELLEKINCSEHLDIFWNALVSIEPVIQAHSSLAREV